MPRSDDAAILSRRTALRGAAGVAGAVWLVPVVTVVSMDAASAASAPPPGGGDSGGGGVHESGSNRVHAAGPSRQANTTLAFTGADATQAAVAGVATVATGAAAIVAARRLRRPAPHKVPTPGRHRAAGDPT